MSWTQKHIDLWIGCCCQNNDSLNGWWYFNRPHPMVMFCLCVCVWVGDPFIMMMTFHFGYTVRISAYFSFWRFISCVLFPLISHQRGQMISNHFACSLQFHPGGENLSWLIHLFNQLVVLPGLHQPNKPEKAAWSPENRKRTRSTIHNQRIQRVSPAFDAKKMLLFFFSVGRWFLYKPPQMVPSWINKNWWLTRLWRLWFRAISTTPLYHWYKNIGCNIFTSTFWDAIITKMTWHICFMFKIGNCNLNPSFSSTGNSFHNSKIYTKVIPSLKLTVRPWKLMVGRLLSFWGGLFSGANC